MTRLFPILLSIVIAPVVAAATPRPTTYINPLPIDIADPFVYRDGETYYLYGTSAREGFETWTSKDLVNWQPRGHVFRRSEESWSRRDFWAPELFKRADGKFLLHFTAADRSRDRRLVLAEGDSPLGPFREIKAPWLKSDHDMIDGHVFRDDDGQLYLYSVALDDPPKQPTFEIRVHKLDAKTLEPARESTLCIKPTEAWEGKLVAEGPFVLRRGDTYFLTWSSNPYWERNYSVGVATAKSPLGPWTKSPNNPILKPTAAVSGPGHHCFIDSPDGKAWFIVYHMHADPTNGRRGRLLAVDRVRFTDGVRPTIVVDGPTSTTQPVPIAPAAPAAAVK
jgi:beta-xylosidase